MYKGKAVALLCLLIWTTSVNCQHSGSFVDSRDNRTYKYVKLGEQVWMAENLKFQADSNSVCYENNISFLDHYGVLYNWNIATKICPKGWHLPSDLEWKVLESLIGMESEELEKRGRRGKTLAIGLKSKFGWRNNANGSNEYGFNLLPSGYMNQEEQSFSLGHTGYYWTSTVSSGMGEKAFTRSVYKAHQSIGRYGVLQTSFRSVRCVKDE